MRPGDPEPGYFGVLVTFAVFMACMLLLWVLTWAL